MQPALRREREPATEVRNTPARPGRMAWLLPVGLAILIGGWALRAWNLLNLTSDAPNHLLNGALIHDWIASGNWRHPIGFTSWFYSHLPAVTIPYHPPLFALLEAAFFTLFGMSVLAGRVLIALMTAVNVLLVYGLVRERRNRTIVAAAITIGFFGLEISQKAASNVMLEMPALMFLLAAIYQLRDFERDGFSMKRAILFGLTAGLAIWTKQSTVFLGLLPFVVILLSGRLRLLKQAPVWVSAVIFGGFALALQKVMFSHGGKATKYVPPQRELKRTLLHNIWFYVSAMRHELGFAAFALIVIAAVVFLVRRRQKNGAVDLMLAWMMASFAVLIGLGMYDPRYLFFSYLPMIVLAMLALHRVGLRFLGDRGWCLPVMAAVAIAAVGVSRHHIPRLNGPAEAAPYVVDGSVQRVLYCGPWVKDFIFATRIHDPNMNTIVFRADRVLEDYTPATVERQAREYGVNRIVVVPSYRRDPELDMLAQSPPPSMVLEREIPLHSTYPALSGHIRVFKLLNPSPTPKNPPLRIPKLNVVIEDPEEWQNPEKPPSP
jgi:hypothetical protein